MDTLDTAQNFWIELHTVMITLKDLEEFLGWPDPTDPTVVEPKAIQEHQVAFQDRSDETGSR